MLCGRDVNITIDGKPLLQAESAQVRRIGELHAVRSCFVSEDIAIIRSREHYKASFVGIRFRKPFENLNLADLDNFTMVIELDGRRVTLSGCMWDDFLAAADREKFREHMSITALRMNVEEIS